MRRSPRLSMRAIVPMSVMMPVNMAVPLALPLVDFESVLPQCPRVGQCPAAVRVGEAGEADVADPRLAVADQDRGAVEQQPIDQIGGEDARRDAGAAFDEE